jgi:hypothetical protein
MRSNHVPFDLNRVSALVIAGLDSAIHAEKTVATTLPQWFRLRQVSLDAWVKPAHDERNCSDPNGMERI